MLNGLIDSGPLNQESWNSHRILAQYRIEVLDLDARLNLNVSVVNLRDIIEVVCGDENVCLKLISVVCRCQYSFIIVTKADEPTKLRLALNLHHWVLFSIILWEDLDYL